MTNIITEDMRTIEQLRDFSNYVIFQNVLKINKNYF